MSKDVIFGIGEKERKKKKKLYTEMQASQEQI